LGQSEESVIILIKNAVDTDSVTKSYTIDNRWKTMLISENHCSSCVGGNSYDMNYSLCHLGTSRNKIYGDNGNNDAKPDTRDGLRDHHLDNFLEPVQPKRTALGHKTSRKIAVIHDKDGDNARHGNLKNTMQATLRSLTSLKPHSQTDGKGKM